MPSRRRGWNRAFLTVAAGFVSALPLWASTSVDYDRDADFSSYKTFAWIDDAKPPQHSLETRNPLVHKRIVNAIGGQLESKGLQEATEGNPDLWISYHAMARERVDVDAYGYRGWRGPGGVQTWRYTEGTLVVDLIDAGKKALVWRGSMTRILGDPEKSEKTINKAVRKLFKKYPPKQK